MLLRALVHFGNAPLAFSTLEDGSQRGLIDQLAYDRLQGSAIFDCALGRRGSLKPTLEILGPLGKCRISWATENPWQGFASFHQTTFQAMFLKTRELRADTISSEHD